MKPLILLRLLRRRLKFTRRPKPPPDRLRALREGREEVLQVPIWIGTQLTAYPVLIKATKPRRNLYDEWQ